MAAREKGEIRFKAGGSDGQASSRTRGSSRSSEKKERRGSPRGLACPEEEGEALVAGEQGHGGARGPHRRLRDEGERVWCVADRVCLGYRCLFLLGETLASIVGFYGVAS